MIKRILLGIGILLTFIILVVVFTLLRFDTSDLKSQLETSLSAQLGAQVSMKSIDLGLWSGLSVDDLELKLPEHQETLKAITEHQKRFDEFIKRKKEGQLKEGERPPLRPQERHPLRISHLHAPLSFVQLIPGVPSVARMLLSNSGTLELSIVDRFTSVLDDEEDEESGRVSIYFEIGDLDPRRSSESAIKEGRRQLTLKLKTEEISLSDLAGVISGPDIRINALVNSEATINAVALLHPPTKKKQAYISQLGGELDLQLQEVFVSGVKHANHQKDPFPPVQARKLNINASLDLPMNVRMTPLWSRLRGKVSFELKQLSSEATQIEHPSMGALDLPALQVDLFKGQIRFDKKKAELIPEWIIDGPGLHGEVSGYSSLGNRIKRSRLDLEIGVELNKDFTDKAPFVRTVAMMSRKYMKPKSGGYELSLRLGGTITNPRPQANFRAKAKKSAKKRKARRPKSKRRTTPKKKKKSPSKKTTSSSRSTPPSPFRSSKAKLWKEGRNKAINAMKTIEDLDLDEEESDEEEEESEGSSDTDGDGESETETEDGGVDQNTESDE